MSAHAAEAHAPAPAAAAPRSPVGGLIVAGVFMTIVIALECVMAYLLIPSADDIRLEAQEKIAAATETEHDRSLVHELAEATGHEVAEVDLDKFTVNMAHPTTNATIRIDFHLYATIAEEEATEFAHLFEPRKHRIRDQVISEIRQSKTSDLRDPELGLIKRRILEKTNEALGKPLLRSVVFSDFRFIDR